MGSSIWSIFYMVYRLSSMWSIVYVIPFVQDSSIYRFPLPIAKIHLLRQNPSRFQHCPLIGDISKLNPS